MTAALPSMVFLQFGASKYFEDILNLALPMAGGHLTLITDQPEVSGIDSIPFTTLMTPRIRRLAATYEHVSRNDFLIELVCFLRWFLLLEYMRRHGAERLLYLDSDVAVCRPLPVLHAAYGGYDVVTSGRSAHTSFFTRDALAALCETIEAYMLHDVERDKPLFKARIAAGEQQYICDMLPIGRFVAAFQGNRLDSSTVTDRPRIDHNINIPRGYEFDEGRGILRLYWRKGLVYARTRAEGAFVNFATLHFQGQAKRHIRAFYRRVEQWTQSPARDSGDYLPFWEA